MTAAYEAVPPRNSRVRKTPRRHGLARAAGVTAALSAAGSGLGLVRDQAIAHLFGAGAESDAFLVAWTVPEMAATVLIEDAMALLMVPAFSAVLARGAARGGVRGLVRGTLPRLLVLLGVLTAALVAGAPYIVRVLAPGLADPRAAVDCTRLTAFTVLTFGVAGYLSAALRAHRRFLPPGAIYVAYNVGIVATLLVLHDRFGVRAAAAGVAVGGALMIAVQLPSFTRILRHGPGALAGIGRAPDVALPAPSAPEGPAPTTDEQPALPTPEPAPGAAPRLTTGGGCPPTRPQPHTPALPAPSARATATTTPQGRGDTAAGGLAHAGGRARADLLTPLAPAAGGPVGVGVQRQAISLALVAPVVLFTLGRQAQVLLERYFASPLPAGAISHLNYAQKVAQLPMALSLMICTVTFPVVSRALAEGDRERAGKRVERDLALACLVVLLGTAYVVACAPQIVHVLFQRGEFDAADTAATARVMRVYALGLLGQSLVGALVRPYFSAARPTWYPAAAMAVGLLVTGVVDATATGPWGVYGIAAGNAGGITVTAALLLRGLGSRGVAVRARAVAPGLARTVLAAAVATAAGWALTTRVPDPLTAALACGLAVPAAFAAAAAAVRAPEVPYLLATVTRRARP